MIYAGDQWIQYPVKDLYDKAIMLMAISTARDMYEKGEALIKEFNKQYADFATPFAKDMERYNLIVGGMRDTINNLYALGIDPLRSAEGRALISRAINSINPAELTAMKANAKTGYAYLDALLNLRRAGKFSQAQEDFDMALTGDTPFADFATANGAGGFNSWMRTSPIEATSLRDLTYDSYKGRTARDLTAEDFKNDPRLKNYAWDPRYQWSGYLDSDLMKIAPGASASLTADPRAAFFRDQARQKVIASGQEPTAEAVERQFLRDIADANAWALIDPVKKGVDDIYKMDYEYNKAVQLENLRHRHAKDEAESKGNGGKEEVPSGSYANVVNNSASAAYRAVLEDTMTPDHFKELVRILTIKNPSLKKAAEDKLLSSVLKKWLVKRRPGGSVFKRLMEVEHGEKGREEINRILDSRAVTGSLLLDNDLILGTNLEKDGNGWYDIKDSGYRVLSSHQLMKNIIEGEAKAGFTITDVNGKKYSKEDIIKRLDDKGDDFMNAWWSTEADIASRAEKIKPSTKKKRYLVAYDESGARKLYMKAKVNYDVRLWPFNSNAEDMWVELPIDQLPIGTPSVESAPFFYGSELTERKQYSNAAVNQTYSDVRW